MMMMGDDLGNMNEGLPGMSFSPTRVDMYERDISTPPNPRGSMLAYSSSLPELPSPAQQSSPFGLMSEKKRKKIKERKDEQRKLRTKNREIQRRDDNLHFWRVQEEDE